MKYKLLKDLPDIKAGNIGMETVDKWITFGQNVYYPNNQTYSLDFVEHHPDWFAPYLFTTEDGVDVYLKDYFYTLYANGKITKDKFDFFACENYAYKYFSTQEKAEEYLKLLQGFKVGDIVVNKYNIISKILKVEEEYVITDDKYNSQQYIKNNIRLATNNEIIKYYEQQGWVKGAKFKCNCDKICREEKEPFIIEKLSVKNHNDVFITYLKCEIYQGTKLKDCELIKEPDYPKSWFKLKHNDKKADSEILSVQELCFRRLQDLHKVIIDEYNKFNNCDWKPDWNNEISVGRIIRCYDYLVVTFEQTNVYHHLVFPTRELAEFSLKHHKDLWKQYYQLH